MAWSDAAREAAALARRQHAQVKQRVGKRTSIIGKAILGSRRQIAVDLRNIRAGVGFRSRESQQAVMEMARLATNTRNLGRRTSKY